MKQFNILLAGLLLFFTACKNDQDGQAAPEEKALSAFLADSLVRITTYTVGTYEMGYRFYPIRNGRITQLGIRMPTAGTYRVSLWDAATKTLLAQRLIEQQQPNVLQMTNLAPAVTVQTNKKYILGVNSTRKPYFVATGKTTGDMLPLTKGNITFLEARYATDTTARGLSLTDNAKTLMSLQELFGFPELVFVATP